MKHFHLRFCLTGIRLYSVSWSFLLFLPAPSLYKDPSLLFHSLLCPSDTSSPPKSVTFLLWFWFSIFLFSLLLIYADGPHQPLIMLCPSHLFSSSAALVLFFYSLKKKKRPLIWNAPLRLQVLYCWISPALTFKWSHSAPSISLPHYIPPFSLSVFSTPSTLMTSLWLLTPVFLSSSIANSPYTTISFNLPSHPAWLMPLTHFFCCLLKDCLLTA